MLQTQAPGNTDIHCVVGPASVTLTAPTQMCVPGPGRGWDCGQSERRCAGWGNSVGETLKCCEREFVVRSPLIFKECLIKSATFQQNTHRTMNPKRGRFHRRVLWAENTSHMFMICTATFISFSLVFVSLTPCVSTRFISPSLPIHPLPLQQPPSHTK